MSTNGTTAKWVGLIAGIIMVLGFGAVASIQTGTVKRVDLHEQEVRRIDKNQAVIIYQLNQIDKKIDKLLEE